MANDRDSVCYSCSRRVKSQIRGLGDTVVLSQGTTKVYLKKVYVVNDHIGCHFGFSSCGSQCLTVKWNFIDPYKKLEQHG